MADEENQEQESASLTLNDVQNSMRIINLAVKRGAFDAKEAHQVGTVYEKLETFINQYLPNDEGDEAEVEEESEPEPEPAKKSTRKSSSRGRKTNKKDQ